MTEPQPLDRQNLREGFPLAANATVVNRTHRVVREQALAIRAQRSHSRSLWLPLGICSSLMAVLCVAIWFYVDGYEVTPGGGPDTGNQLMVLMVWSIPVTIAMLGVALFHRRRNNGSDEVSQ